MTSESAPERRHGTRELIERLLNQRQHVWVLYERLAGVEPYADRKPRELQSFVEVLVDYIAAAHFGLYARLTAGEERRKGVLSVAEELYPQIVASTDFVVAFNDKYAGKNVKEIDDGLAADLSELGEQLALRNELEDRLIAAMTL